MKKIIILTVFLICISSTVFAQRFYFDIGFGFGQVETIIGGNDIIDTLKSAGIQLGESTVDLGLKIGYRPFDNIRLYTVGEFGSIMHRIGYPDSSSFPQIQFNTDLFGPGIIFYPIPYIQLGSSIGFSFARTRSNISEIQTYNGHGFAWNISTAIDVGKGNHGCLIGVKYFNANNTLKTSKAKQNTSMISFFVRYAFRDKTLLF